MTPTNNALPELRPLLTRLYQHSADCYKAAQESNDVVIGVGQLLAISRDIDEVLRELCHASAGREAVAWQCRLIAIATGEVVDDWRECSKESFDVDGGRPRDGAYLRTEYRALYLPPAQPPASAEVGRDSALSRGVPEAEPFVSCTCHEERQKQLCLNKHRCVRAYPLAAIAAQRKEG